MTPASQKDRGSVLGLRDMAEVFKVVRGKYDSSVSIQIPTNEISSTTGNKYKLINPSTGSLILLHQREAGVKLTPRILCCILFVLSRVLNANQLMSLRRGANSIILLLLPGGIAIRRVCLLVRSFAWLWTCIGGRISWKRLEIATRLQWSTYRKSYLGYQMVTCPMRSHDHERSRPCFIYAWMEISRKPLSSVPMDHQ